MQQAVLMVVLATMVYAVSLDLPPAVAGLWGIWHIVSGGTLAVFWRRVDRTGAR